MIQKQYKIRQIENVNSNSDAWDFVNGFVIGLGAVASVCSFFGC